MRRATRALVVALALVVVMAFSAGQALAGWGWEDCPPASSQGQAMRSDTATAIVSGEHPSDVSNVHSRAENPGNKYETDGAD